MALQDYNNFLENSLAIDSRYPTLEEFLLALGHCIPEKPSEEEKKRITDSQLGRVVISKKDIVNYLSSMKLRYDLVMMLYINVIKQPRMNIMSKNSYLHVMLFTLFVRRFNLKEYFNKDKSPLEGYSRTTGFKDFLKDLVGEKNGFYYNVEMPEGDNSEYLDNLYDWLDGGVPTIGALERFLQHVALVENSPIKANRNKILVLWFFQSMSKKYPHDEKQFASKEYLDQREKNDDELEDIDNLVIGPKMPYSLADNTERIEKAKEKYSFDEYPFIAQIEIKHFIYQRRYKDAMTIVKKMVPLFFYLCSEEVDGWFSLILSFVVYNYTETKDKNEKKSLKSLLKRIYNFGGLLEIDGNLLEFDRKENEEIVVSKYYRRFIDWNAAQNFYGKQKKEESFFPEPDYKKVNQKRVTFGDVVNCPQLIFYTQLNEPDIVCNLLKKGAKIDASTPSNESALYWNLINLDLTAHLNCGRTMMCPPESKLLINNKKLSDYVYARKEAYFKVIKGMNLEEDLENGYNVFVKCVEEQHKDAYKIFKALLPHYQDPKGNWPLSTFQKKTLYGRTIMNVAVCTGNIDIISSVIDLYKKYCGENNTDKWINEIAEFQPRTPVFWVSRLYHYLKEQTNTLKKLLTNNPATNFVEWSKCNPQLIAKSWNAQSPYNIKNFSENYELVQNDLANPIMSIIQNLQQYWEHRYIQEKLPENKLLAILQLLLDNHADPLVMIDGTTINFSKEFNALHHAIYNGWLEGVKMMVEHIKSKGNFDVEPYLKFAVLQPPKICKPVVDYLSSLK